YSTMKNELTRSFNDLIIPDSKKKAFVELLKHRANIGNPIFYFHGAYGTGKKLTAGIICKELGMPLLVVDSNVFMKEDPLDTLRIIIREARLQNSSLYLDGFGVLLEKEAEINVAGLFQELDLFENWIFLAGELPYTPASVLEKHGFISEAFPIPSFELRKKLWEKLLKENVPDLDIDALASKFNFSGGQIEDAISSARNLAIVKKPENPAISMENLYRGCKAQSNKSLSAFAKNIPPRYTWEDIVLPKDIEAQLREVSGYIKYKGKVYIDWGFDAKLSLGKGLNVLFSGSSGAGKTMAAEVIAKESGLDLYKIDLSSVVSKYIGETEKILKKIFLEAETSNAILFFDEADALFGKRSEVKDAHDRYANIETNYLLQKMEEHEGIVILASNFKANIDEAFLRRMHFAVEFTSPEEDLRERIWTHIFPGDTPINDDVDYSFLSKFKITGGNIKNIALNAAFLAAGDSDEVRMEHIIRATKREFQKMGKLCTFGDFGEYYALVK
ncbi:MAG: ATP-binding protein, partial [Candidatus Omnitrophica bacterium]|nr:ATP-binding protein [Candidatus Omnitrophota bacterium]